MLEQLEAARARARMLEDQAEATAQEAIEAKAMIVATANAAIDEIVRASGLTYGEILGPYVREADPETCTVKPASKRKGDRRSVGVDHPRYALIGDPTCTYSRGPVPLWMKREMEQKSLDPANKQDREAFRMTRMVQVHP